MDELIIQSIGSDERVNTQQWCKVMGCVVLVVISVL